MQTPSDRFLAKISRGAIVSTLAANFIAPEQQTEQMPAASPDQFVMTHPSITGHPILAQAQPIVTLAIPDVPGKWTDEMRSEFRKLSIAEATGKLSSDGLGRLEVLSQYRERLLSPRTTEEILLQLRRDRILARMAETIKEYVEFKDGADRTRSCAS